MSFAKKYLQQYNADSAWDSMRGGTGAYDYSSMPEYMDAFRRIKSETTQTPTRAQETEDLTGQIVGFAKRVQPKTENMSLEDLNAMVQGIMTGDFANLLLASEMSKQNFPVF